MSLSVAAQVLLKLKARLEAIDGTGEFNNDMTGRVFMRQPIVDLSADDPPRVFISRRVSGETREQHPNNRSRTTKTVIFDVVGAVSSDSDNPGLEAEALLADIERALELQADRDLLGDSGSNLVSSLALIDPEIDSSLIRANAEIVGVGVRCVWPHKFGDPSFVQP